MVQYEAVDLGRTSAIAPVLDLTRTDGFLELSNDQCKAVGTEFSDQYQTADPFAHIVFENFLPDAVLRRALEDFPRRETGRFNDDFSRLKTGYTHGQIRSAFIHDLLTALNSPPFLRFLQNLTGIKHLIADPYYLGGGLHETARGGHLSIHADFNMHPQMKIERRINLILFLNEDWDHEWGGALELWDKNMKACRRSVDPVFGRAVIFNTDATSYHGHPDPLQCPPDVFRRSLALYYYTATGKALLPRTTRFQPRPGSNDERPTVASKISDTARRLFGKGS